jgi:hypothetical protein
MGYFFDWIDMRWQPKDHSAPTRTQIRRTNRRRKLVFDLLTELEHGTSMTTLYSGLLARALVQADQELMNELGETVANVTKPEPATNDTSATARTLNLN